MNATYTDQAQQFLDRNGITFRAVLTNTKEAPWQNGAEHRNHFRITLGRGTIPAWKAGSQCQLKRVSFDFWDSLANADKGLETVTPYDVLACINSDAHVPDSFEDFCSEYGFNTDSRAAEKSFKASAAFAKRLRAFFTAQELEQLSEIQ